MGRKGEARINHTRFPAQEVASEPTVVRAWLLDLSSHPLGLGSDFAATKDLADRLGTENSSVQTAVPRMHDGLQMRELFRQSDRVQATGEFRKDADLAEEPSHQRRAINGESCDTPGCGARVGNREGRGSADATRKKLLWMCAMTDPDNLVRNHKHVILTQTRDRVGGRVKSSFTVSAPPKLDRPRLLGAILAGRTVELMPGAKKLIHGDASRRLSAVAKNPTAGSVSDIPAYRLRQRHELIRDHTSLRQTEQGFSNTFPAN